MIDIKFRAYDKKIDTFLYIVFDAITQRFESIEPKDNMLSFDGDREPMQQYIGLKDKNGVEIFEGDIIPISNKSFAYVSYNNNEARYELVDTNDSDLTYPFHHNDDYKRVWYEVIGNIYQNKELLGENNEQ